jgi:glycerate kinase
MRVIIAPNSFREGPRADAVAEAMAEGVRRALPSAEAVLAPLADGGDGTLAVVMRVLGGSLKSRPVRDPLGRPVMARFGVSRDGSTAVIEMAEASGLRLVPLTDRDPFHSSSYGTGELIRAALDLKVTRILVGAGGSGTIDAGVGALAALGAVFRDPSGTPLDPTPAGLITLAEVDLAAIDSRLAGVELIVLGDVHTPLQGNATVYGKQKGVRPETASLLAEVVRQVGHLAQRRGHEILKTPWRGAGGGLAGGLAAFAGGRAVGGAEFIARLAGFPDHLRGADLLLTGEGRLDVTTAFGKLPLVIAGMAADHGVAAVIIAGSVMDDALVLPDGVTCFSATPYPCALDEALAATPIHLVKVAEQVTRLFAIATKGEPVHANNQ